MARVVPAAAGGAAAAAAREVAEKAAAAIAVEMKGCWAAFGRHLVLLVFDLDLK